MTTAVSVRQNHIISIMFARHSNEQRLLRWLQSIAEGIQQRPSVYPSVRLSVHAIHFLTVMRVSLQERLYQSGCYLEADSCGPKESCIRLGCTFSPPGEHVGMTFATAGRDAGCHHHYCNNLHVSGFVRQIKLAFHQFLRVHRKASFTAHELNWTELIWTSHMQSHWPTFICTDWLQTQQTRSYRSRSYYVNVLCTCSELEFSSVHVSKQVRVFV